MASNPITSWQIYAGKVEIVAGFTFLGSKITAYGDCSHRIKRRLPLGRKTMTNLDSVLKSRNHFATKGPCSQSYGFSMYGCASWTIKKAECRRRLLRALDCKEIQPVHPKGNQF